MVRFMNQLERIWNDSGHGIIEVPYCHLAVGTAETYETPQSG